MLVEIWHLFSSYHRQALSRQCHNHANATTNPTTLPTHQWALMGSHVTCSATEIFLPHPSFPPSLLFPTALSSPLQLSCFAKVLWRCHNLVSLIAIVSWVAGHWCVAGHVIIRATKTQRLACKLKMLRLLLHNSLYIFNINSALLDECFAGMFSDLSQFHKDSLVLMHFLENHFGWSGNQKEIWLQKHIGNVD